MLILGSPANIRVTKMSRNLKTVAQFADSTPFTSGQVRWWIFQASQNGLADAQAILRIGRRVYIDTDAFDRWLTQQQPSGMTA